MKSLWTAERRQVILDAAREGNSRDTCAGLAGISPPTLSRWVKRGEEAAEGSQYRIFAEELAIAEAATRGRAIRILNKAMVDEPKWAAWYLERRDPAFTPPQARQAPRPTGPQVIVLSLNDGTPLSLPSGDADVIEGEVIELEEAAHPA